MDGLVDEVANLCADPAAAGAQPILVLPHLAHPLAVSTTVSLIHVILIPLSAVMVGEADDVRSDDEGDGEEPQNKKKD